MLGRIKNMKWQYKVGVGVATGAAIIAGGGAAFAYFTATGSNTSGAASVGTSRSWTINSPTPTGTDLYPDQGSETFAFVVTNAGGGTQGLQTVTATVNDTNSANCPTSNYQVVIDGLAAATGNGTATETYSPVVNVAKTGTHNVSVVVTLPNQTTTDQSGCSGDAPTVTLSAT